MLLLLGRRLKRAEPSQALAIRYVGLLLAALALLLALGIVLPADPTVARDYLFVFALGGLIGVADVFSRYQEAPLRTLSSTGALIRIAVNAAASGIALWIIKAHPFTDMQPIENTATQIVAAGFGALALLRLSVKAKIGDQDVSIGPASLVDSILAAADRDANRASAAATVREAFEVKRKVPLYDIATRLAPLCVEAPQTLSDADRRGLYEQIKRCIERADCSDSEKSLLILATLARVVGWDVVHAVADEIVRQEDDPAITELAKQAA